MKKLLFTMTLLMMLSACGGSDDPIYESLDESSDFRCQNSICIYNDNHFHTAMTYNENDTVFDLIYELEYEHTRFSQTSIKNILLDMTYDLESKELSYTDLYDSDIIITCTLDDDCESVFNDLNEVMYVELLESIKIIEGIIE